MDSRNVRRRLPLSMHSTKYRPRFTEINLEPKDGVFNSERKTGGSATDKLGYLQVSTLEHEGSRHIEDVILLAEFPFGVTDYNIRELSNGIDDVS